MNVNDKTAATFPITFSAIDARRAGKEMYDVVYEMLNTDGTIDTDYAGTMTWNS